MTIAAETDVSVEEVQALADVVHPDSDTGASIASGVASLGGVRSTDAIALATGIDGRVLRRDEGVLAPGRPADLAIYLAPPGGAFDDPLAAIQHGDIPGIGAVVIDGQVRALRSRNAPAPDGECRPLGGEPEHQSVPAPGPGSRTAGASAQTAVFDA